MNHILLVEDNQEIYQMVSESINQIAKLTWAKSVESARDEISKKNFDLILLDIELPDGNGIEFCSSI